MGDGGWVPGKFVVKHYRRGDLLDGEAFVLVPCRDPAACEAVRAYANATPDPELSGRLIAWVETIDGGQSTIEPNDKVPGWVLTLATSVREGNMDVETALYTLAGYLQAGLEGRNALSTVRGSDSSN